MRVAIASHDEDIAYVDSVVPGMPSRDMLGLRGLGFTWHQRLKLLGQCLSPVHQAPWHGRGWHGASVTPIRPLVAAQRFSPETGR